MLPRAKLLGAARGIVSCSREPPGVVEARETYESASESKQKYDRQEKERKIRRNL
jgi:hypothetical protein